jgi:hypothetical protein
MIADDAAMRVVVDPGRRDARLAGLLAMFHAESMRLSTVSLLGIIPSVCRIQGGKIYASNSIRVRRVVTFSGDRRVTSLTHQTNMAAIVEDTLLLSFRLAQTTGHGLLLWFRHAHVTGDAKLRLFHLALSPRYFLNRKRSKMRALTT